MSVMSVMSVLAMVYGGIGLTLWFLIHLTAKEAEQLSFQIKSLFLLVLCWPFFVYQTYLARKKKRSAQLK